MKPKFSLVFLIVIAVFAVQCSEDNLMQQDENAISNQSGELKASIGCGEADNGYPYCCTSTSDPDGDGWGWEQDQSCVVNTSSSSSSSSSSGCGTTSDGYPICCDASSDPDGDGWGWENDQSCVVEGGSSGGSTSGCGTTSDGYPICCDASSDPDGDGWGWENDQSCVVEGGSSSDGSSSSGSCPSSLSCPSGMNCGCYTVSGLGSNKQSYRNAGASNDFLASAMMETELMNTNYTYGDGKSGDAFNAGACKQNWGMMRVAYGPWQGLGSGDYATSAAMNSDKSLDVTVYNTSRSYFGSSWWAGHRNGSSGLDNPDTQDINNFKAGWEWTRNNISGHETDDVRFWVDIPAI